MGTNGGPRTKEPLNIKDAYPINSMIDYEIQEIHGIQQLDEQAQESKQQHHQQPFIEQHNNNNNHNFKYNISNCNHRYNIKYNDILIISKMKNTVSNKQEKNRRF